MNKETTVKPLGYVSGLDGLRAFAILLVMLSHANFQFFQNGGIGVPVFFALSGFLITTLLLEEFKKYNKIEFKAFYIRRTFRLFPALYCMLLFTFLYALFFNSKMYDDIVTEIIAAGLYVYNLSWIWNVKQVMLYHTWSLGVEEQFYLIWPILLFIFLKYNSIKWLSILLTVFILFIGINETFVLFNNSGISILNSITNESIFMGCLVAILRWKGMILFKIPSWIAFLSIISIFLLGMFPHDTFNSFFEKRTPGVFAILIILYLIRDKNDLLSKIFTNKLSVFIGKISYSLYLWHLPVFKVFSFDSSLPSLVSFFGKFIVSLLFALLSWFLLEKKAITYGHKWSKKIISIDTSKNEVIAKQ